MFFIDVAISASTNSSPLLRTNTFLIFSHRGAQSIGNGVFRVKDILTTKLGVDGICLVDSNIKDLENLRAG